MIDRNSFAAGMALLAGTFSRNLEAPLLKVYYAALSAALTNDEFERAIERCIAEETFWPPVAVIVGKIRAVGKSEGVSVAVDAEAVIRRIEKLATYNPNRGLIYPNVEAVRTALGDAAAYGYAAAGGARVFSENETSREIATREFHKAMIEAVTRDGSPLPVLGAEAFAQTARIAGAAT